MGTNKVESFHNRCLRKILRIFWLNRISKRDLSERKRTNSVVEEIKQRSLRWLGHVFRMSPSRIPKVASNWTPPGKIKPGRPQTTWRRMVEPELHGRDVHCLA